MRDVKASIVSMGSNHLGDNSIIIAEAMALKVRIRLVKLKEYHVRN